MEIGSIGSSGINSYVDKAKQASGEVTADSFEARLNSAMEKKDDKELKEVCKQFESIMLGMLYKQMKATIPKSDFMKDDSSTEIFQSMLDDELVDSASKQGSLGLADMMYKQLSYQTTAPRKTAAEASADQSAEATEAGDAGGTDNVEKPGEKPEE